MRNQISYGLWVREFFVVLMPAWCNDFVDMIYLVTNSKYIAAPKYY